MREHPPFAPVRPARQRSGGTDVHPGGPRGTLRRKERGSLTTLPLQVTIAIAAVLGWDHARVLQFPSPHDSVSARRTTDGPAHPFMEDDDVRGVLASLRTAEEVAHLLSNAEHVPVSNPFNFFRTYRQSPEAFRQAGWRGPCNNFAEYAAAWAHVHDGIPYIVSLCSTDLWGKITKSWHQVAVCKLPGNRLAVFDNDQFSIFEGTLPEYVEKLQPGREISCGGIIRWQPAQDDFRAKLVQHFFGVSPGEMREAAVPLQNGREKGLGITAPMEHQRVSIQSPMLPDRT